MKRVITILVFFTSVICYGQRAKVEFDGAHWNAPYTLSIPFGWSVERSCIQGEPASQVPFIGIEDSRYSPGWGNTESEQYWSYDFLWYLDGSKVPSEELIEKNLNARYTALLEKQNISKKKVLPVKSWITEPVSEKGDLKTYYGAIAMLDYMGQKPISLNCIVHVKAVPEQNKTVLFFEVSPKPLYDEVWKSLDQLWLDFDTTASEHKPRLSLKAYFLSESVFGGG